MILTLTIRIDSLLSFRLRACGGQVDGGINAEVVFDDLRFRSGMNLLEVEACALCRGHIGEPDPYAEDRFPSLSSLGTRRVATKRMAAETMRF